MNLFSLKMLNDWLLNIIYVWISALQSFIVVTLYWQANRVNQIILFKGQYISNSHKIYLTWNLKLIITKYYLYLCIAKIHSHTFV